MSRWIRNCWKNLNHTAESRIWLKLGRLFINRWLGTLRKEFQVNKKMNFKNKQKSENNNSTRFVIRTSQNLRKLEKMKGTLSSRRSRIRWTKSEKRKKRRNCSNRLKQNNNCMKWNGEKKMILMTMRKNRPKNNLFSNKFKSLMILIGCH